jgi:transglutaminase superfamily protein
MSQRSDKLAKLCRLTGRERRIFFLALVLMPTIAIGLRLFGFRRVQMALVWGKPGTEVETDIRRASFRAVEVARLVAAAARHGPYRASCLPVSLTLGWLLHGQGIRTQLRLGVRKVAARLEAHAWIEHQGVPLIDTPEIYDRFAAFDQVVAPRKVT